MPKRIIRDWTDSERVNKLTPQAERFLIRLMMKADDFGRFHAQAKLLRSFLFPLLVDSVRDSDVSRWIAECETAGLIRVYEGCGKPLLEIVNFGQRLRDSRPKFPAPEETLPEVAATCRGSPEVAGSRGKSPPEAESELEAGSGSEKREADGGEPTPLPSPQPSPVLVFPCAPGRSGSTEWPLMPHKIAEYTEAYPGIDAISECRKALQWCRDNPSRLKTADGMTRFLNSWLSKAQNDSRSITTQSRQQKSLLTGLLANHERHKNDST